MYDNKINLDTNHSVTSYPGLAILSCIILLSSSFVFGADIPAPEKRISLNVKNELMGKVLTDITQQFGYGITISNEISELPITISFNELTLNESLRRVSGNYSRFIVIDEGKRTISLGMVDFDGHALVAMQSALFGSKAADTLPPYAIDEEEARRVSLVPKKMDPLDEEVVPPANPGEKAITERELNAIRTAIPKTDPMNEEVVPPANPGEPSITAKEVEAIRASFPKTDSKDEEAVPPANLEEPSITDREMNAVEVTLFPASPRHTDAVPPTNNNN